MNSAELFPTIGAETDRLVAALMGWRYEKGCAYRPWNPEPGWTGEHGFLWNPSENIAQAWRVLDHLAKLGWRWNIYQRDDGAWIVFAVKGAPPPVVEVVPRTSAAYAICRAALVAIST